MVTARAVLPMLGRPARISRSEGCRPPSFWSRPVSLVGTPETLPTLCQALSMCLIASVSTTGKARNSPLDSPSWASANSSCSASSICSRPLSGLGGVEGAVDRVLADLDQAALEGEVVDHPAVVGGVDDGVGRLGEPAEIARAVELAQRRVLLEQALERDRVGELAAPDRLDAALEDPGVDRLEEMLGAQELADAVIGVVVDQDGAEQRLLGLDVVRLDAEGAGFVGRQGGRLLRAARVARLVARLRRRGARARRAAVGESGGCGCGRSWWIALLDRCWTSDSRQASMRSGRSRLGDAESD